MNLRKNSGPNVNTNLNEWGILTAFVRDGSDFMSFSKVPRPFSLLNANSTPNER